MMTIRRTLLTTVGLAVLATVPVSASVHPAMAQTRPVAASAPVKPQSRPIDTRTVQQRQLDDRQPVMAQPQGQQPALPAMPELPPPFGANLFSGAFQLERSDGLNADYVVAPGDRIAIRVWGEMTADEVAAVDAQGNIFIPSVGPVQVAGTRANELDAKVRGSLRSVYTNNVEVYVNLLTATPVTVYVTGPVLQPGQYAGLPSDSLLSFLHRAGGIDAERGSYRKIKVLRAGKEVARVDLYRFLIDGHVPAFRFRDGDVVLVERQGLTVTVDGTARNPFRFEFAGSTATGAELMDIARPMPKVSHAGASGNRDSGPFSVYVPLSDFRALRLQDGDSVRFQADDHAQIIDIGIEGSHLGPSYYAVNRDTTLKELLDHIAVDTGSANVQAVYLRRRSVARQQRQLLDESLRRLEQSVLTAPASSDGEATIRVQEAALVSQFVERARAVQPEGRVIVARDGKVADIRLEDGDTVIIPQQSDLIMIAGEVLVPQAVVYSPRSSAEDYIARSGGLTERADPDRFAIMRANGAVEIASTEPLRPGDSLLVLPKVDTKGLQITKDIMQVIYQIAVAAAVALAI
ncbi:sugar transporter [Skermanella stibiiresistens SB22]|uniref:Sugar transporter n=2 Tax=Skermanella TaxID=204447 RepID=W9GYM1_9PROT|nr:sugar transporter [Skermanella stibiiresistens SB22]